MMPYYLLDEKSPLPVAFQHIGWGPAKYVVAVGSLCALSTSLLGSMFPMPRVLFAMARDGLLFQPLTKVTSKGSPAVATIASGIVAAFMALLFDLKALVDMMSIGTLFAYTLVAVCILILRYQEDPVEVQVKSKFNPLKPPPLATASTSQAVTIMTVISVASMVGLCVTLTQAIDALARVEAWSVALVCILGTIVLINTALIFRQPQNGTKATFMMPLVPFLPILSIFINSYLMVQLGPDTWIRYAAWMAVGLAIYFIYGIRFSTQRTRVLPGTAAIETVCSKTEKGDIIEEKF
ncbi:hypothetical protein fugu_013354 [Takifugu bimaculatus]|uniref:Uncharacterized protein n=1 Tax=Takifugu bimaculatus TaxID=433685 RepID=A0A4Z2C4P7_9TELE|nr:hypothetical protein fugu_013354 [Takifugu bimaculatus]